MPREPQLSAPPVSAANADGKRIPRALDTFWRTLIRHEPQRSATRWVALRNCVGVVAPLILGALSGQLLPALVISSGAFNVALSDGTDAYRQRARRMLASSVFVALAVFFGAWSGKIGAVAIVVSALWAFVVGMLAALPVPIANLGVSTLATLLVFAGQPVSAQHAALSGLLALLGGLFQTSLSLMLWPVLRYEPERQALGDLYAELSQTALCSCIEASESPPASAQITRAQESLATLARDHSVKSERYRSLLTQAERSRLCVVTLARLRSRVLREPHGQRIGKIVNDVFTISARWFAAISEVLRKGISADPALDLEELTRLIQSLRDDAPEPSSKILASLVRDILSQTDALARQLRVSFDMATNATPAGSAGFAKREAAQPWKLRFGGTLATLRANLSLGSAVCRHAVRLAACIALGDAIGRGLDLHRSYWLPLTIGVVLKPDFTGTFTRGVLRILGTFIGLILATTLFHLLPQSAAVEISLIAGAFFLLRWAGPLNYGIFVIFVSAVAVLMISVTGIAPGAAIFARGLNTAIGGSLALLAYWLWPTWERTQTPEAIAQMLDAYRLHFRAVAQAYLQPETRAHFEPDRTRLAARLARSNSETSVDRLGSEPGTPSEEIGVLGTILASSHRFIHSVMALESGLFHGSSLGAGKAFHAFSDDVDRTLETLARILRSPALANEPLPDLREDHHRLAHSGEPLAELHSLLVVEADRITNSINTLCEQVVHFVSLQAIHR